MKKVEDLQEGDYVAFPFNYNGGEADEIIVNNITSVNENRRTVLVHFLYGHHSLAEFVKFEDILAIGNNESGEDRIIGWSGKFDIVNHGHFLIREKKKR